jgi:hypothetical protein
MSCRRPPIYCQQSVPRPYARDDLGHQHGEHDLPRLDSGAIRREYGVDRLEVDRLHEVMVEAGAPALFTVRLLSVSRQSNQPELLQARDFAESGREFVPIHNGQADVEKGDGGIELTKSPTTLRSVSKLYNSRVGMFSDGRSRR